MRRHRGELAAGTGLLVVWQVSEVLVPVAIGIFIDAAIIPRDATALLWCLLGLAVLFTVLSFSYRFGSRFCVQAMQHEAHDLRVEVARVPLGTAAAQYRPGEVLSLASADADVAAELLREFGRAGAAVIGLLAAAAYLLFTDPLVGLVVLVGVPLSILLVAAPSQRLSRRSVTQQEAIASAGQLAGDLMRGLRVLKAVGGETWALSRFRRASEDAAAAGVLTSDRLGRVAGLGVVSAALVLGAVILAAGWRVVESEMAIGTLVSVVGVAVFFEEPLRGLAQTVGAAARSHGAAARLTGFLSGAPGEVPGSGTPASGRVRVSDLPLSSGRALELDVPEGQFLALAVDQPADARVIVDSLAGAGEGAARIMIGGIPRNEIGPEIAAHVLVAPHDVDLFEGTICSNITMRHDQGVVDDAVLRASATSELLELLADGLEHELHDGGSNLSGGQRQRIALARALHADPQVLVLHDPTSAVDALTEWAIARAVVQLRRGRTTIVVGTSPGFLSEAGRVAHIPAAGDVTSGGHRDLMKTSPDYRRAVQR